MDEEGLIMKKLLGIVVLGLLWCNVGFAKDLTGIKLLCKQNKYIKNDMGLEFSGTEQVIKTFISELLWKVEREGRRYWVDPAYIWIHGYKIDRETLIFRYGSTDYKCSIVEEDFDFWMYFHSILGGLIEEQEKKNKL